MHLVAAKAITDSKQFTSDIGLWLYEEAFKRGAHKPDFEFFRLLTESLKNHAPAEIAAAHERALILASFRSEGTDWAKQVVDFGSDPYEFLNARELLIELKDPAGERADLAAIANLLEGVDMKTAEKTLASEKDPARKAHAVTILTKAVDDFSFPKSNRLDVVAAANTIAGKIVATP